MNQIHEHKRLFADPALCLGCKTCELRCAVDRGSVCKTVYAAVCERPQPRSRVWVQQSDYGCYPLQCRHCEDAACLDICPVSALLRDDDTGCVVQDTGRCIGCYMCVAACPAGLIYAAPERHMADKCDQCCKMERQYCAAACPTGALRLMTPSEYDELLRVRRARPLSDGFMKGSGL